MATDKINMPNDKQIWAEVDKKIAEWPEVFKKVKRFPPDRNDLFAERKAWYKDAPKRLKAQQDAEKAKQVAAKKQADEDKAYIALRKAQGKPIITVKKFKTDFPNIKEDKLPSLTARQLHEQYDLVGFILEAKAILSKYKRLQAATRELTYKYLSQTYGLYRRIIKSEAAEATFDDIRAFLWNDYKIKTHYDSPRASILLKWVFDGLLDKTVHLYSRCLQLADGYDVEEADFKDFIKQMGGMEKIRKAYATVIAADAGKLKPEYVKDAEYLATKTALHDLKPLSIIQLSRNQCVGFNKDLFGYYSLVLTHLDPMGQLEIYAPIPSTKAIEKHILDFIADIASNENAKISAKWHADKHQAEGRVLKMTNELLIEKEQKKQAKQALKLKKEAALAKKNAADVKRFEKQRKSKGA